MYGAMLGDIIGAPYEFNRSPKIKNFGSLFVRNARWKNSSRYTDDSLMTVAVCDALLKVKGRKMSDDDIKKEITDSIMKWANAPEYTHIKSEYGAKFRKFVDSPNPVPYNSCGNGSAMRVSAAGYLFDTLEETRKYARLSAEVSHNHPEGIRGAEAIASVIFLARTGKSKEEIRQYIVENFASDKPTDPNYDYNLKKTVDGIRPGYRHRETCQECVPQAIVCFLEADNFEDAIRNAISIGGDTDTIGCMVGSMAEAFYGVPKNLIMECKKYITPGMQTVTSRFYTSIAKLDVVNEDDFDAAKTSPLSLAERAARLGNLTNDDILVHLDEQLSAPAIKENGKKYIEFIKKAVTAGYPIEDAEAFWLVQTAINSISPKAGQDAVNVRDKAQRVLDEVISNTADGKTGPLTIEGRTENIKKLRSALGAFFSHDTGLPGLQKRCQDIITDIRINDRLCAPLSPGDRIRLADNVHDIFDILETTDPSLVMSSSEFKSMKESLRVLVQKTEELDSKKPESVTGLLEAQDKLKKDVFKYVKYKRDQLKKGRKRSRVEMLRVSAAESLLDRLKKNNLNIQPEAPDDPEIRKILIKAKTAVVQNDNGNKEKAAAVLLSYRLLKKTGEEITEDVFRASYENMMTKEMFAATVSQFDTVRLQEVIDSGEFEKMYTQVAEKRNQMEEYLEEDKEDRARRAAALLKNQQKTGTKNKTKVAGKGTDNPHIPTSGHI